MNMVKSFEACSCTITLHTIGAVSFVATRSTRVPCTMLGGIVGHVVGRIGNMGHMFCSLADGPPKAVRFR